MNTELKLRKVADMSDGITRETWPGWFEVDGLPNGLIALVESEGRFTGLWRLKRIPADKRDKGRNFASTEDALATLRQELE